MKQKENERLKRLTIGVRVMLEKEFPNHDVDLKISLTAKTEIFKGDVFNDTRALHKVMIVSATDKSIFAITKRNKNPFRLSKKTVNKLIKSGGWVKL